MGNKKQRDPPPHSKPKQHRYPINNTTQKPLSPPKNMNNKRNEKNEYKENNQQQQQQSNIVNQNIHNQSEYKSNERNDIKPDYISTDSSFSSEEDEKGPHATPMGPEPNMKNAKGSKKNKHQMSAADLDYNYDD